MLKPRDKVNLVYYEFDRQVESHGWLVEEYDNGLLKATLEPGEFLKAVLPKAGRQAPKQETVVFNMRSVGFLKAEVVE